LSGKENVVPFVFSNTGPAYYYHASEYLVTDNYYILEVRQFSLQLKKTMWKTHPQSVTSVYAVKNKPTFTKLTFCDTPVPSIEKKLLGFANSVQLGIIILSFTLDN
jgi:hypothetical protein